MSYDDVPNRQGLGEGLSYGNMPTDILMRKFERTNNYEDPMAVENHIRDLLVDFRPDKPFLASDEKRDPNDGNSGFQSRSVLNIRHCGARSADDPYLEDGVFLDHEFTSRDPRGHAIGPNMRQHYNQQLARASYIKMSNDADYSTTEQGIAPRKMYDNIRHGQYDFAHRYKNFSTAKGNFHTGGTGQTRHNKVSSVAKVQHDGVIMDLAQAQARNRIDATSDLSRDLSTFNRHATPDHIFKISKYGQVKSHQGRKDWSKNRSSTFMDHKETVDIKGVMVNKMLAELFADLEKQREAQHEASRGAHYGLTKKSILRKRKITPGDLYQIMQLAKQSQGATAHQQLNHLGRNTKKQYLSKNRDVIMNAQINHKIIESMASANKKMRKKERIDVRDRIEQTAVDSGIYLQNKNTTSVKKSTNKLKRQAKHIQHIEDSHTTKNYMGIKPREQQNRKMYKTETYKTNAKHSHVRRKQHFNKNVRSRQNHQDEQSFDNNFGTYNRADYEDKKHHMGRDYNQDFGDIDIADEELNQIEENILA